MSHTKIGGLALKRMIIGGANELNKNKQLVDSLNVFPVPDGDTGTNMSLTATSAAREIEKIESTKISEVSASAANGSLRGARGNSGVILSQLIRGFSKGLADMEEAGTRELAQAARNGVRTAYKAVMKPKEGTILTVARVCADVAEGLARDVSDIETLLERVIEEGHVVLAQTKEMLPVLKQADVVDAGGMGLLFVLEGALSALKSQGEIALESLGAQEKPEPEFKALASVDNASIKFGYCTEFFIDLKKNGKRHLQDFKNYLCSAGDSVVVISDEKLVKVHVHTNHPGRILEKALLLGSLNGMKIDNMREQHTNKIDFSATKNAEKELAAQEQKKSKYHDTEEPKATGFIAISSGSGLAEIFNNLGVDEIIEGGQTMNPSTEDILNAIERVNAGNIIILPNNGNIILAAQQAAKLTKNKRVEVIPTKTVPEGITAMINFTGAEDLSQDIEAMTASLSDVKTGMVTYAVRDTTLGDTKINAGDILGILDGEIAAVEKEVEAGAKKLLGSAISEDNDMVTIYYGQDVSLGDAENIARYVEEKYPCCEVELHCGNQPLYYYIFSVE